MLQEIITRHPANPILTADDIPGGASSVFNSGFIRHEGKIVGKRLKAVRWRNQPDFDNEILALEFEGEAILQLFATVHRQRIWGHIEDG